VGGPPRTDWQDLQVTSPSGQLVELAHAYGVMTEYVDFRGTPVQVSAETIEAVLAAMGVDVSDPGRALEEHDLARWRRMVPHCLVVVQGQASTCWVHVVDGDPARLEVELEDGTWRRLDQTDRWVDPRDVDGTPVGEATFAVPADLPLGYHRLHASSDDSRVTGTLIITPAWLGLPDGADDGPSWGFATQLYSVRSQGSWGVGDLADLATLATWSAGLGADYVLVNPLHAAEPLPPLEPSPYLPSSRRFFNPLYLRVEEIPEYAELPPAGRATVDQIRAQVPAGREVDAAIERDPAWAAKLAALLMVHGVQRSPDRARGFAEFRAREGDALLQFATWSVLAEDHGNDAREWPEELRDMDSQAVADFAGRHVGRIGFAMWLQWVLDEQLQAVQAKAVAAGMRLGTMHDLAVGVHPGGADAWRLPHVYAGGVRVGAPPDPYNRLGQNWSQPPWRPDRLEELAYAPFRELIGAVLRHAGGVRVDHIIGLFRLWWIPEGHSADQGTYVHYDHEALVGVLALEAQRAGAVVVGEDLGVVAPEARGYLRERGILGTSILWFERDGGGPLPAERWREWCLASVTTHDLPPSAGYLAGDHVRLQHRLGLLQGDLDEELAAAAAERETWLAEVRRRTGLAEDADVEDTVLALHRYLALTPARMLCVALTDAVGDRRTQNQPGTVDEYPNWRVPLAGPDGRPLMLEDVVTSTPAAALAAVVLDR
jgi:4-alpha-glucanotransferase